MEHEGHAWALVSNDACICTGPAVVVRIVPHMSVNGGDVTLYDGRGTAGRSLGIFHGLANTVVSVEIGALCEEGIYVDIGSNVTSVLVIFDRLEEP